MVRLNWSGCEVRPSDQLRWDYHQAPSWEHTGDSFWQSFPGCTNKDEIEKEWYLLLWINSANNFRAFEEWCYFFNSSYYERMELLSWLMWKSSPFNCCDGWEDFGGERGRCSRPYALKLRGKKQIKEKYVRIFFFSIFSIRNHKSNIK